MEKARIKFATSLWTHSATQKSPAQKESFYSVKWLGSPFLLCSFIVCHLTSPSLSSFWIRASGYAPPNDHCLPHFIHDFDTYTTAVIREADDRTKRKYRTFLDYLSIRRDSSGCLPSFALCEFGLNLPEEAFYHPRMVALREQGTDLIAIGNVGVSFFHPRPVADNMSSSIDINRTSIPTPWRKLEVWSCTTLSNS